MMVSNDFLARHVSLFGAIRGIALGILICVPTGCDAILEVQLPGHVPADALGDQRLAETLVLGAIADFDCALQSLIGATSLLTDEMQDGTNFIAVVLWAQRQISSDHGGLSTGGCAQGTGFGAYTPLQVARFQAEETYRTIEEFPQADVPNKEELLATAAAYAGYSTTLLGEAFCEMALDLSPIMQPREVLERAEEWFTTAIEHAQAGQASDIRNMALVGRARVRLNMGNAGPAASDAREVPEGYVRFATRASSPNERRNLLYVRNNEQFFISVDPRYLDLTVDGVPDPRVPVIDGGRLGHDQRTPLWIQQKYASDADPIPIASWKEAQLIIAEAEGGQEAVERINQLRARFDLPLFESSDEAEIQEQVVEERRRELYLEGRRHNDMIRLGLPFDSGDHRKGAPYGPTECLPLPDIERFNNPNI